MRIVAFDPGQATGVFTGIFTDNEPLRPSGFWIIHDGPIGIDRFLEGLLRGDGAERFDIVVSERFVPTDEPGARETVSPQGEGVLMHYFGRRIRWQLRGEKEMGFGSQLESDELLKTLGWWQTGSLLGHDDGRDANDAAIHALQSLRKARHKPTLRMITDARKAARA